jgi:hypothetical protein
MSQNTDLLGSTVQSSNSLIYYGFRAFAAEPCTSKNSNNWKKEVLSNPKTLAGYAGKPLMVDHSQNCRDVMGICQHAVYGEGKKRDGTNGVGLWVEGRGITTQEMWVKMNGDPERGIPPMITGVSVGGDGEGHIAPDGTRVLRAFNPQELSITPFPSIATAEMSELTRIMESYRPQTPKFITVMQEKMNLFISEGMKVLRVDPNELNFSETFAGDKLTRLYKRAEKFQNLRQEGVTIPPVVLFERENGSLEIHDGHARVVAARREGITPIDAILMIEDGEKNPSVEEKTMGESKISVTESTIPETQGDLTVNEKEVNERFSIIERKIEELIKNQSPTPEKKSDEPEKTEAKEADKLSSNDSSPSDPSSPSDQEDKTDQDEKAEEKATEPTPPAPPSVEATTEKLTAAQQLVEAHKFIYHTREQKISETTIPASTVNDAANFTPANVTNPPNFGGPQTGGVTAINPVEPVAPTVPAAPVNAITTKTGTGPSPPTVSTTAKEMGLENYMRQLLTKHEGNVKAAEAEYMQTHPFP